MKKNLGTSDRVVRLVIAVVITIAYFAGFIDGIIGTILLVLAAVITITGLVGFCPIYPPFGLNTYSKKETEKTPKAQKVRKDL